AGPRLVRLGRAGAQARRCGRGVSALRPRAVDLDYRAEAGAVLLPLPSSELLPPRRAGAGARRAVEARLALAAAAGAGGLHRPVRVFLADPHRRPARRTRRLPALGVDRRLDLGCIAIQKMTSRKWW